MPSYSRELALLGLVSAALLLPQCSALTKIDWSVIPPAMPAGGMMEMAGASDHAGETPGEGGSAGVLAGAAGESGEGGSGGEGDMGETGGGGTTLGGTGGTAGKAGSGGSGGTLGGTGGGDTGGNPGVLHPTCATEPTTPTTAPDLTGQIVFFDGGPGQSGNRGGRTGLDAACAAAKTALHLPQAASHAVISVSLGDQIYDMPEHYKIPRTSPHVVSPLGLEVASSWDAIWKPTGIPHSLICAGVMPETVHSWLTGTGNATIGTEESGRYFGLWDYGTDLAGDQFSHSCNEWGFGTDDPDVQAVVGSTSSQLDGGGDGNPYFIKRFLISCEAATDHILCVAYDPLP